MYDLFGRSPAFHLAIKMRSDLQCLKAPPLGDKDIQLTGKLNLSHGRIETSLSACLEITVWEDWFNQPPKVVCKESWMRIGEDWHVYEDYSLCWVLDDQWRDVLAGYMQTLRNDEVELIASTWCLTNVKDLIYKHRVAQRQRLKSWPTEWIAWRHGDQGRRDYLRESLHKKGRRK